MIRKARTFLNVGSAIALFGAATLWAPQASADPVTYAISLFGVDQTNGATVAVAGSITTDGTLGLITERTHILDWNVVGAVLGGQGTGSTLFDLVGPLSGTQNSTVRLDAPLTATALTLALPNSASLSLQFFSNDGLDEILFAANGSGSYFVQVLGLRTDPPAFSGFILSSPVFADGKSVSSPVPGPIVGAGLPGVMLAGAGLLGWWRSKRKA